MQDLLLKIDEWNRNSLELFRLSEPNENQEFFGVVRFYFYAPNDKYYSKCVRISSTATARHLVNVLVEKFHPDLRLLKSGRYALYEYHPATGVRRLGADERPLMNQINWKSSQNEGRFILRDESKLNLRDLQNPPVGGESSNSINMAKWRSAGNLMTEAPSMEAYTRSQEALVNSADELVFPVSTGNNNRGKSAVKKKTKSLKSNGNKKKQNIPASSIGDQAVMRTASLPNFLGNSEPLIGQNPQAGSLTIMLENANLPDQSQTIASTIFETSSQIIQRILGSYGGLQNTEHYNLEQFNYPPKGESLPYNVPAHRILRPGERPLHILRSIQTKFPRIRCQFQLVLQHNESLSLQEEVISPQPDYVNVSVKKPTPQLIEVNPNGTAKTGRVLRFNLSGLLGEEGERSKAGVPIKMGSQFASVGPPPNILLSANRFPDIRPVHCTLLPASSASDGSNGESMGASILISPALDITTRPPCPTSVHLDGKRVVRPTPLRHGCVLQLGRSLFLKFLEQGASLDKAKPIQERTSKGSMPDLSYQGGYKSKSPERQFRSRTSLDQPTYSNTDQLFPDLLPIIVDVCLPPAASSSSTKDDFAACIHEAACDTVDAVLKLATSLSFHTTTTTGPNSLSTSRPPIFVLTPAFLLYGLLRGCLRRWKVAQLTREQHEHYLSGLLNHIGSQMFQCIQNCCHSDATSWSSLRVIFNQLLFWLANSSELRNFLNNDMDFSDASQTSAQLLSNCINLSFHELRRNFLELINHLTPSLLFPGDYDQQDDVRLDDRSLSPNENIQLAMPATLEPNIQRLLQCLAFMMRGMRQACVNVSFALQFFAYVFHAMGAWIFNSIVQTEGRKNSTGGSGGLWMTRLGAGRLMRRLQRVKQWAGRHGIGSVCEVNLLLPVQTCQLITADRSKFRPFQKRVLELRSLNSAKVEWLLSHLGDPPPLNSEWVKNITKSVRQDVDREIIEKHGSPSSRETRDLLSLQTPVELPLPLIVPPEGYVATSGLTGIPEGFFEAIQPLVEDGCLSVRQNDAAFEAPLNGMWTGHFTKRSDLKYAPATVRPSVKSLNTGPTELNVEKLAREAGVNPATVKRVVLQKNGQPLGLGIVAAKPEGDAPYGIYIRHIVPDSVAAKNGGLEYGDQILAIANSSLVNCDQSEAAVAILARTPTTVHLVVAKQAAQARGIINLINSAQSGRPLQGPLNRSNPYLNRVGQTNRLEVDDSDDDDDDDNDIGGARFGSRVSLGDATSQNSIFRPKSAESYSNSRGYPPPKINEFDVSSEEITSEEGSDEVWQPNEKSLNPNPEAAKRRPSSPIGNHSFQPSPASVQGSLDNYKYRSQQDLRSTGLSNKVSSSTGDNGPSSADWNEVARRNAEIISDKINGSSNKQISPTLSSLSSTGSIVTQEEKKDPQNVSKPSQEGVYTNASELNSVSEDILTTEKQQSPPANRVNTAEKNTSPLNVSPARSVTDKAMQTVIESTNSVQEGENKKSSSKVSQQVSAVQTDPIRSVQDSEEVLTYTPPLNRLPVLRHPETRQISPRPNRPLTRTVQVEDVTKAVINPYVGRFQQQPHPEPRTLPKVDVLTASSSYSDLRMPYSTVVVNTASVNVGVEPSTIQSGVTYWSSQTDLAYTEVSPPPEPTADFPQYHPPARLEPSDLAIKFGDVGTPRDEASPSRSPSIPLSVYGPPASRFIPPRNTSRDNSPRRLDLIQRSRELSTSDQVLRTSSLNRTEHTEAVDSQSRQLQDLSREIRRLEDAIEVNPNADLIRELDRLRVEYRFKLQMNDRNRTRSLNVPYIRSPDAHAPSNVLPTNASKIRPLVPNITSVNGPKSRPLENFANERLESIRLQEQRARLYEESFNPKPTPDFKSLPPVTVPPMQPKYTYQVESGPMYDDEGTSVTTTSISPRFPQTIRQSPPVVNSFIETRDSQIPRGAELRASRKSVTFNTNLESVALYSPNESPPENSSQPSDYTRRTTVNAGSQLIKRTNQSPATEIRGPNFKPNVVQPENAENLSFKDKMAFFAKAIGEDMPKDRYKASQKERQILNSLTR
ncbi:hypothetical protein Aperf_G00000122408 [Anoplocephala perfoliata]